MARRRRMTPKRRAQIRRWQAASRKHRKGLRIGAAVGVSVLTAGAVASAVYGHTVVKGGPRYAFDHDIYVAPKISPQAHVIRRYPAQNPNYNAWGVRSRAQLNRGMYANWLEDRQYSRPHRTHAKIKKRIKYNNIGAVGGLRYDA